MTAKHRGRVCIFTTAHPLDDVRVHSRMATAFLGAGYEVSWIGPDQGSFASTAERDDNIDYHLFQANSNRAARVTAALRASHAALRLSGVDWWYCPDPDAARAAVRVAKRRGGRVLFDIHEVFHGALLDRWFPGGHPPEVLREAMRKRIARTCREADLVVGVGASVLRPYLRTVDDGLIVRNCAPVWFAPGDVGGSALVDVGVTRVMHGKANPARGTDEVLAAVAATEAALAARLEILMMMPASADTAYSAALRTRVAAEANAAMVRFLPSVAHHDMPAMLGACQVGMIAYGRDFGVDSFPNRLFEYMAAGIAILAPAYSSEIVRVLDEERIGTTADFEDPADIVRAFAWIDANPDEVRAMGERARTAFVERYNWDVEKQRLLDEMHRVENAGSTA